MPYQNLSCASLVNLFYNRVQNNLFWSSAEAHGFINEALRVLQVGSLYFRDRFDVTTVAGQVFYDLTSTPGTLDSNNNPLILMPIRGAFNGAPLDFSPVDSLDNSGISNWQCALTTTKGQPTTPQLWGTIGLGYLFTWPTDAVGNNALLIDAAVRAPQFATDGSQDTQTVNIDSSMVGPLLDYCQHIAQIKRGTAMVQSTMPKLKSFLRLVAQQNSMFAASSLFKATYADQTDRKKRFAGDMSGKATPARYR